MFKSKIQQKAKLTFFPILLIFAISLSLIFYFLSSKSKKPQYRPQKFEHQIGVATGSETKSNFPQSTSSEIKDIYAFVKNAIGDFYFENTKEIKAKEYGIPKLKACIYSDDCVLMAEKEFKYSQSQEIPNEILTFPKDLLLETLPKKDWRKKFEDFPYEEYKNLKEKLEKFSNKEYKEWLAQTIKNKSQSSPTSIDYATIKDFSGNKITVLRILQSLGKGFYTSYFSMDIFYYAPNSQKWRKLWGPTIYSTCIAGAQGMNLDYFLFNDKTTIFTIDDIACGPKGLLCFGTLRRFNIGYVFYNENIVPVFYNSEDKYILPLSQLLPSYSFPKPEDLSHKEWFEWWWKEQGNPFFEFPFIERIHKDKTYDYLLVSHDSKLWLVVYNRVNKIIEERKFIKKLNLSVINYLYADEDYGDFIMTTKIPIIVDIDQDEINEVLIPSENPWFYFEGNDYLSYHPNVSKPIKIEFYKFIPNERNFVLINPQKICELSSTYFESIKQNLPDEFLALYRASLNPLRISYIESFEAIALNTLIYNVCTNGEYKFSFVSPHFKESLISNISYSLPALLKIFKVNNDYVFLYQVTYRGYSGFKSEEETLALLITIFDTNKNKVYTYLLRTTSELPEEVRYIIFRLDSSNIILDKDKIKLDLEFSVLNREEVPYTRYQIPFMPYQKIKKEYTIQLGKTSDQTPLISQFSGE